MAQRVAARSRATKSTHTRTPTPATAPSATSAAPTRHLLDVSRSFIPPDSDDDETERFSGRALAGTNGRGGRRMSAESLVAARARMQGVQLDETAADTVARDDELSVEELEAAADAEAAAIGQPARTVLPIVRADNKVYSEQAHVGIIGTVGNLDARAIAADIATTANPPTPAAATAPALALNPTTIADGDALWDWIRQDDDRGASLFGSPVGSSIELHARLQQLRLAEQQSSALIRAIVDRDGTLIGFVELNPMLIDAKTAVLTIYLAPWVRQWLPQLLAPLVNLVSLATPFHVALPAPSPEWADLYRRALPEGFIEHRMFVR